jgi:hypothetical protein
MKKLLLIVLSAVTGSFSLAQPMPNNGIGTGINDLYLLSNAQTRSISPENLTGEKGKRRNGHP